MLSTLQRKYIYLVHSSRGSRGKRERKRERKRREKARRRD
jgi:hypothetical protein